MAKKIDRLILLCLIFLSPVTVTGTVQFDGTYGVLGSYPRRDGTNILLTWGGWGDVPQLLGEEGGTSTLQFSYSPTGLRVNVLDNSTATNSYDYVYDGGLLPHTLQQGDSMMRTVFGPDGEPLLLMQTESLGEEQASYLLQDSGYNTRVVLQMGSGVSSAGGYSYGTLGATQSYTEDGLSGTEIISENPFRLQSHIQLPGFAADTYSLPYRLLGTGDSLGIFFSRDPAGMSISPYTAMANDWVNNWDADGLMPRKNQGGKKKRSGVPRSKQQRKTQNRLSTAKHQTFVSATLALESTGALFGDNTIAFMKYLLLAKRHQYEAARALLDAAIAERKAHATTADEQQMLAELLFNINLGIQVGSEPASIVENNIIQRHQAVNNAASAVASANAARAELNTARDEVHVQRTEMEHLIATQPRPYTGTLPAYEPSRASAPQAGPDVVNYPPGTVFAFGQALIPQEVPDLPFPSEQQEEKVIDKLSVNQVFGSGRVTVADLRRTLGGYNAVRRHNGGDDVFSYGQHRVTISAHDTGNELSPSQKSKVVRFINQIRGAE